jgi:hypothetical protein
LKPQFVCHCCRETGVNARFAASFAYPISLAGSCHFSAITCRQ